MEKKNESPKKLYLGSDTFEDTHDRLCVDKSLFLKAFVGESSDKLTLIQRPRRGGKTTVASMLYCFLTNIERDTVRYKDLFRGTKIAEDVEFCRQYQGQYPVISISLKDINAVNYQDFLSRFKLLIKAIYDKHIYLLDSPELTQFEKESYSKYLRGDVDSADLELSCKNLSKYLYQYHKKKVFIIIDEYDSPLNQAHLQLLKSTSDEKKAQMHEYCTSISLFLKNFFGCALKSNDYLEKGLMMGILRVSKNEMLSSLNNLRCYGVLDKQYSEYFGFTEAEVIKLLQESNLDLSLLELIRTWYNGYKIGGLDLYNPWSIMNFISDRGTAKAYWVMTGSIDQIIQQVMLDGDEETKSRIRALIGQSDPVTVEVSDVVVFEDFLDNASPVRRAKSLWSLLLSSGYLTTSESVMNADNNYICQAKIPNREVRGNYLNLFSEWLQGKLNRKKYQKTLDALCSGDITEFTRKFGRYILKSTSLRDFHAESDYQAMMIGVLFGVHSQYEVKSNIEIGFGYPDFTLLPIPKINRGDLGIILELKHLKSSKKPKSLDERKDSLIKLAQVDGLNQIEEKHYSELFESCPQVQRVIKVGIAFCGKMMVCAFRENSIKDLSEETNITVCFGFDDEKLSQGKSKKKKHKAELSDEAPYLGSDDAKLGNDGFPKLTKRQTIVLDPLDEADEEDVLLFSDDEQYGEDKSTKRKDSVDTLKAPIGGVFGKAKKARKDSDDEAQDSFEYKK